jgi:hypothetical protein
MDVEAVSSELNQLGPDEIDRFDFKLLKPVEYKEIY